MSADRRKAADKFTVDAGGYALGLLGPQRMREYEDHLRTGCEACAREVKSFQLVAEGLAASVPPSMPSDRVLADLLNRVRQESESTAPPGFTLLRGPEARWHRTQAPGVRLRTLSVEKGFRTFLLEFQPGATFPHHLHLGLELCYVISGDINSGDVHLTADDFQRAEEHSASRAKE